MAKDGNFCPSGFKDTKKVAVLLLCLDWSVLCEDIGFGRRHALLDIMKCVCFSAELCL